MERHEWKRIDSGSIARCLQCSCGFKAGGYTWADIDKQVAKHEAAVKAFEDGREDCKNQYPPRSEDENYLAGYTKEHIRMLKELYNKSKV